MKRRIIVAITGATGSVYGRRMLEELGALSDIETHLIITPAGALNIATELDITPKQLQSLADVVHSDRHVGASIASGSFRAEAMLVAPCSMKTLGSVASGVAGNLVARAADVTLKERRRLVMLVRETPLNLVHLRNMTTVTEMGGIIMPPVPAFYAQISTIGDMVDQTVARALELVGVRTPVLREWSGIESPGQES